MPDRNTQQKGSQQKIQKKEKKNAKNKTDI